MNALESVPSMLSFLRCVVGQQTYALPMLCVHRVQRLTPDSPAASMPVVPLAARVARAESAPELPGKLVVFKAQPHPWALAVEAVDGVMQVPRTQVWRLPAQLAGPTAWFDAVLVQDSTLLLVLCPLTGWLPRATRTPRRFPIPHPCHGPAHP